MDQATVDELRLKVQQLTTERDNAVNALKEQVLDGMTFKDSTSPLVDEEMKDKLLDMVWKVKEGRLELEVWSVMTPLFCRFLLDMLDEHDAPNLVSFVVEDGTAKALVTVQRPTGMTSEELRVYEKARADSAIDAVESFLKKLPPAAVS